MTRDPLPDKLKRIDDPAVAPLNSLVRGWRAAHETTSIPWFDPDDGGVHARLLILMESPATRTVASAGSGFCSMDNADGTNRLLASLVAKAGISRAQCIKWNTVPWALTDEDGRPRAARRADINAGAEHVREVLTLTTELDIVLTLGNAALAGFMLAVTAETPAQLYRVLAAPHPSQRNAGSRSTSLRRIENALSAISMEFRSARSRRSY